MSKKWIPFTGECEDSCVNPLIRHSKHLVNNHNQEVKIFCGFGEVSDMNKEQALK